MSRIMLSHALTINRLLLLLLLPTFVLTSQTLRLEDLLIKAQKEKLKKNLPTAARIYDQALLTPDGQYIRNDLPTPQIAPILEDAGRVHYDSSVSPTFTYNQELLTSDGQYVRDILATPQVTPTLQSARVAHFHLLRAIAYLQRTKALQPHKSHLILNKALIDIYTKIGRYNKAEDIFAHLLESTFNHPEVAYDYAVWLLKRKSYNMKKNKEKAKNLLHIAANELGKRNVTTYTLHSGLSKQFYIRGLIMIELGKLLLNDEALDVYQKHGKELWKNPRRRFVAPLNHDEFVSKPHITFNDHTLYPLEDVQWLEKHYDTIKNEVIQKTNVDNNFHSELENLHNTNFGNWTMLRFTNDGVLNEETCALLPITCEILMKMPSLQRCLKNQCNELFVYLSNLSPHTNIDKHCGPTWKRLRLHLPLKVPKPEEDCCWLEVLAGNGESPNDFRKLVWKEGQVIVFDDSYEHSVHWKNGSSNRLVLIVDVDHPTYSKMLRERE
jgi:tetratricopeptide (TPR) repeat protein